MRVLCVKQGDKYGPEWVYRLRDMVARNLPREHQFECLTDDPIDGVRCVNLPTFHGHPLQGWWAKIALFNPGLFPGLNLYFDLDVVVNGDLGPLCRFPVTGLRVRDDFSYSVRHPKPGHTNSLLGYDGAVNSSVMSWCSHGARKIWDDFSLSKMTEVHGDQNWITQCLHPRGLIHYIPDEDVKSYKYHYVRGQGEGIVTVFHGEPKVTDLPRSHELRRRWEGE